MKQQAKKSASFLVMLWLLTVSAGVYQAWPELYLQQEKPPELPAFEDCPHDYVGCFARAIWARKNKAADRLKFSDSYASRVRNHLAAGTVFFLLPIGLFWLLRYCRIGGTTVRKSLV